MRKKNDHMPPSHMHIAFASFRRNTLSRSCI